MRTVRLIVAFLAGIALTTFAALNWVDVSVRLWTGTPVVLPLPLVIAAAVLLGAVPVWAWASAGHWSLRRKLGRAERSLDAFRPAPAPAPAEPLSASPEA